MRRVMVTWLAIGLAIGLISQVQADDGDPWTPGEDKPGTSISVESNADGVTIYIAVSETSRGSSSDPSSSSDPDTSGGWSCTADVMNIGEVSPWGSSSGGSTVRLRSPRLRRTGIG